MMDYPAWHSRSEGFVFRDYDGSRLSPLAVWIRGKKIVLFAGLRKINPRGSRRRSRMRRAHHKATILSIAPQSYFPRRH